METLQTDEQITPITTIKRHIAAGRVRHRPRSFEGSRGRSPLITWDLDLYPQPPTNTHSPTLNSEEPHTPHGNTPRRPHIVLFEEVTAELPDSTHVCAKRVGERAMVLTTYS